MTYVGSGTDPLHNIIISTTNLASCGDTFATSRGAPASTAWGSANRVLFVPFYIAETVTVVKLLTYNGATAAGANDIGIFDRAGNRIVAGANPNQAGTTAWQEYDITDTTLTPELYFVGLKNDGTTGTYFAVANQNYGKLAGVCQAAGAAGGLASSYTYAVLAVALVPIVAMSLRVTI